MSKTIIPLIVCLYVLGNLNSIQAQINSFKEATIASFKKGEIISKYRQSLTENQNLVYVVHYESAAPWAEVFSTVDFRRTGDMRFNELMETYDLQIVQIREVDEDTEIILIEQVNKLKRKTHLTQGGL